MFKKRAPTRKSTLALMRNLLTLAIALVVLGLFTGLSFSYVVVVLQGGSWGMFSRLVFHFVWVYLPLIGAVFAVGRYYQVRKVHMQLSDPKDGSECLGCGYSLRGLPALDKHHRFFQCPECGDLNIRGDYQDPVRPLPAGDRETAIVGLEQRTFKIQRMIDRAGAVLTPAKALFFLCMAILMPLSATGRLRSLAYSLNGQVLTWAPIIGVAGRCLLGLRSSEWPGQ